MDEGAFAQPVTVGRTTVTSLREAGAFLLDAPLRVRGKKAYRLALRCVVRGLSGQLEVEAARQGFAEALAELSHRK